MQLRTFTAIGCIAVALVACGGGSGGGDIGPTAPAGGTPVTVPGDTGGIAGGGPTAIGTGGGTGGGTTASTAVPASALQSVDGFLAFVRGLASDETSEPLTLPNGEAPTSGTIEPAA